MQGKSLWRDVKDSYQGAFRHIGPKIIGMSIPTEFDSEGERIAIDLVPATSIQGDDEKDTAQLRKMSERAKQYISSFPWCAAVLESYFAGGMAKIFTIFFFHIRPSRPDVDSWIWIVVGDIPSAYLPLMDCKSPAEVFNEYMRGMSKWVELARLGQTGTAEQGVPPVNVPATPEWAENLNRRLESLMLLVKPYFEDESNAVN